MVRSLHRSLSERQLRWWLLIFFFALAIPALLLIYRAYDQLKWEVFHQYRISAEELSARIDGELHRLIEIEESRSFGDYAFLSVSGDPGATFVQRSSLSAFPVAADIPGLVGYFQVDSAGKLSSPIVPTPGTNYFNYGVNEAEYRARLSLNERLQRILNTPNEKPDVPMEMEAGVAPAAAKQKGADLNASVSRDFDDAEPASNVFDRLSSNLGVAQQQQARGDYGRVEDLKLDSRLEKKSREQSLATPQSEERQRSVSKRASRKEQVAVYELADEAMEESVAEFDDMPSRAIVAQAPAAVMPQAKNELVPVPLGERELRVRLFEGEIDPFSFEILDLDHFVLFRNVWRAGERFIQGAVIERAAFIDQTIARVYRGSALAQMSDLLAAYEGEVIAVHASGAAREYLPGARDLSGELLYRTRLSAPVSALELIYTVTELPFGPGARYLAWLTLLLGLTLSGGCYIIYRYGIGQISLYRQQQDFVSAVSHELKTPLTSIRMYSEMLTAGWADEDKKAGYYAFIHDESERLSRLITNVLQLSRMTRGNDVIDVKPLIVRELLDLTESKVASQVRSAGFELKTEFDDDALTTSLSVDADAFTQIMINLIDNAIKFSPSDALKRIDLGCTRQRDGSVCFTVRDYGSGVPKDQMRRIFELFYRPEGELTRETVGTGIGLALVHQMTVAMSGRVDVQNRDPGAEFSLTFPANRE